MTPILIASAANAEGASAAASRIAKMRSACVIPFSVARPTSPSRFAGPSLSAPRGRRGLGEGGAACSARLLLPALHRPFDLRRRGFLRPDRLVLLALELDEIC